MKTECHCEVQSRGRLFCDAIATNPSGYPLEGGYHFSRDFVLCSQSLRFLLFWPVLLRNSIVCSLDTAAYGYMQMVCRSYADYAIEARTPFTIHYMSFHHLPSPSFFPSHIFASRFASLPRWLSFALGISPRKCCEAQVKKTSIQQMWSNDLDRLENVIRSVTAMRCVLCVSSTCDLHKLKFLSLFS